MTSDTHLMEKVVLYGAIGLVILFTLLVLILALATPIQAAQPRLGRAQPIPQSRRFRSDFDFAVFIWLRPPI